MLDVKVVAGPEFEKTRVELLKQARAFQRRVASATRRAVDRTYRPTVVAMMPDFMPDRYAGVLSADLVVSTSVRFSGSAPGVTVSVSAPTGGSLGGRDVSQKERGELRHPDIRDLWPRHKARGEWRWHGQRITRGFASKPIKVIRPKIVEQIDDELAAVADDVKGA